MKIIYIIFTFLTIFTLNDLYILNTTILKPESGQQTRKIDKYVHPNDYVKIYFNPLQIKDFGTGSNQPGDYCYRSKKIRVGQKRKPEVNSRLQ